MNEPLNPIEQEVRDRVSVLRDVPSRDPHSAEAGRIKFLQQAEFYRQAVSTPEVVRHNGWKHFFNKKEPYKMTTLSTLMLIFALAFGGTGAAVAASQTSLPDQPLYSVKLASEQVRSELTVQTQSRLELALELATQRVNEMTQLNQSGQPVPEMVATRLQQQLALALNLSAAMDGAEMTQALNQVQATLREQQRLLTCQDCTDPIMLQTRTMLQSRLMLVESGLSDPALFRERVRSGQPEDLPQGTGEPNSNGNGNANGAGSGTGPQSTPVPGQGNGNATQGTGTGATSAPGTGSGNPWTTGTPTPGSGYGPGPGPSAECTCTPGSGDGSQNPWTDETPTPGSGYGPGPGPQVTEAPPDAGNSPTQSGGSGNNTEPPAFATTQSGGGSGGGGNSQH